MAGLISEKLSGITALDDHQRLVRRPRAGRASRRHHLANSKRRDPAKLALFSGNTRERRSQYPEACAASIAALQSQASGAAPPTVAGNIDGGLRAKSSE